MTDPATQQTYEMAVPDTLDLAERADLALHGIANTIDPEDEYNMWFEVFWWSNPPYMLHSGCDVECAPKFLDALHQLRIASGSEAYLDVEREVRKSCMSYLDPHDGLFYSKYEPQKRPWGMGGYGTEVKPEDYALPGTSGIMLTALVPGHDLGIMQCEKQIRGIVRGLERISIVNDGYAYYPVGTSGHPFCCPRSGWGTMDEPADDHEGGEGAVTFYFGYPIRGLAMWAASSGDERALDLAGKFARFVMKKKFWGHPADPPMVPGNELGHVDSHLHARAMALRGLLEYGIVAGDPHVLDFVRTAYEQMRHYGIHEIGFHPCWPEQKGRTVMEGCLLGDLVALTVRMSKAGISDYWEDADRIIRNHLAEAQYIRKDLLECISAAAPRNQGRFVGDWQQFTDPEKLYPGQACYNDVLERSVGLFASYLTPVSSTGRIMQCCTANAARGLYYAWESITGCKGEDAEVNLLLNRAAPWLDIESHLPYEGKVVIRNKTARRINLRIPAWVNAREIRCSVNGHPRSPLFAACRAVFTDLKPRDTVEINFPVKEWSIARTASVRTKAESAYSIAFRGNTVVDISPRDDSPKVYPMYRRDFLKTGGQAPVRKVYRTVYEQIPRW